MLFRVNATVAGINRRVPTAAVRHNMQSLDAESRRMRANNHAVAQQLERQEEALETEDAQSDLVAEGDLIERLIHEAKAQPREIHLVPAPDRLVPMEADEEDEDTEEEEDSDLRIRLERLTQQQDRR